MGSMKDLLGDTLYESSYPASPGFKETTTSRDAAHSIKGRAEQLRERVLAEIVGAGALGLTADECAVRINETVLAVRPRVTELFKMGKIRRSGVRRKNESGMTAHVYVAQAAQ